MGGWTARNCRHVHDVPTIKRRSVGYLWRGKWSGSGGRTARGAWQRRLADYWIGSPPPRWVLTTADTCRQLSAAPLPQGGNRAGGAAEQHGMWQRHSADTNRLSPPTERRRLLLHMPTIKRRSFECGRCDTCCCWYKLRQLTVLHLRKLKQIIAKNRCWISTRFLHFSKFWFRFKCVKCTKISKLQTWNRFFQYLSRKAKVERKNRIVTCLTLIDLI